jgi:hypothetical protein
MAKTGRKNEIFVSSYSTAPGTRVFDVSRNGKTVRVIAQKEGTTNGGNVRYRLWLYPSKRPERMVYISPRDRRGLKESVLNFVRDFKLLR